MSKKLKELTQEREGYRSKVMTSARQIYLAGLGAFSRSTEEGRKLFDTLVTEGEKLEGQSRDYAEKKVSGVVDRASDNWDRLESVFEERVAKVINRLGVPTHNDVKDLSQRVDELNQSVQKMLGSASKPKAPARSTAKKTPASTAKQTSSAE
ncbi:phasin family protein [Saccharospirillum salsuginis]|uniref:Phosphohistidine phosphatase n=1 Tax=Saccharospirillum salsuginis TaxID=418750 RepID=A0A918NA11_9GAMM|nr:phasin family protein [Saccharospirillum salsuginis]GGX52536.1 phosphohistidine phosphatase [Saccharospirillum salsuginis]